MLLSDTAQALFKDVTLLGQGSGSTCFVARCVEDGCEVVVKEIDLSAISSEHAQVYMSGIKELRTIKADSLLSVRDVLMDTQLDFIYITLEYCSGGSLQGLIRQARKTRCPIPEENILAVLAGILEADRALPADIETLSSLKLSNVLIDGKGRIKLAEGTRAKDSCEVAALLFELCTLLPYTPITDTSPFEEELRGYSPALCEYIRRCLVQPQPISELADMTYIAFPGFSSVTPVICSTLIPSLDNSLLQSTDDSDHTPLMRAVLQIRHKEVQQYTQYARRVTSQGETALMMAAARGFSDAVAILLKQEAQMCDSAGRTALMYAAEADSAGCVGLLLPFEKGMTNQIGQTALIIAAVSGSESCIYMLRSEEAGICDAGGMTALMYAAFHGHASCVQLLLSLEQGQQTVEGETALMSAVRFNQVECVKVLAPVEANFRLADGRTASALAIEVNALECLEVLLDHEATKPTERKELIRRAFTIQNRAAYELIEKHALKDKGELGLSLWAPAHRLTTPSDLMLAAQSGDLDGIRLHSKQMRRMLSDGYTALMYAASNGHTACIPLLVSESNMGCDGHDTALTLAMLNHDKACAEELYWLERHCARVTPLMWAAYTGDLPALNTLLDYARARTCTGMTALMYAALQGHAGCVQILAQYELRMRDCNGWTALMHTSAKGSSSCVCLLLEEARITSLEGKSALMYAIQARHFACVDELLAAEARISDSLGMTALMYAAKARDVAAVHILAEYESGMLDRNDRTALIFAVEAGNEDCVEALLGEADIIAVNGTTALSYAMRCGSPGIVRILSQRERGCIGLTPLMIAAALGNVERCQESLEGLHTVDSQGMTALMYAALASAPDCVSLLLEEAGRINNSAETALILAIRQGSVPCIALLAPDEASITPPSGLPAIIHAIQLDCMDGIGYLLDSEAEAGFPNGGKILETIAETGKTDCLSLLADFCLQRHVAICTAFRMPKKVLEVSTALIASAVSGDVDKVRQNLSLAGSIRAGHPNSGGGTALHQAVLHGHVACVELLLCEAGILTDAGTSALQEAIRLGNSNIIRLLLPFEAGINGLTYLMCAATMGDLTMCIDILDQRGAQDDTGWTALMYAAKNGRTDVCLALMDEAGLMAQNNRTALMEAIVNGHEEVAQILIPVEACREDAHGWTAMMLAASKGEENIVRALAAREARFQTETGLTALMIATQFNRLECIDVLLSYEQGLRDTRGWTALMHAAHRGNMEAVALLQSELQIRNAAGQLAAQVATEAGHLEIANYLTSREAAMLGMTDLMRASLQNKPDDVAMLRGLLGKMQDSSRRTAIMYAATFGHLKCLELLDDELGLRDSQGQTPLMHAVLGRSLVCSLPLIATQADARANNGKTALDLAKERGDDAIIAALQQ